MTLLENGVDCQAITLADIFGSDHVLVPRAPFGRYGWLPTDPAVLEYLTGGQLTVAGDMPVLCHQGVATQAGLTLLRDAGLQVGGHYHVYESEEQYRESLRALSNNRHKLVFQHLHPPRDVPAESYWIEPTLLSYLNNKGNLADLVPAEHVPQRMLMAPLDLIRDGLAAVESPVVIKAATDLSTGGGLDVVICKNDEDLRRAVSYFRPCEAVVVEEYIPIRKNFCVQFAATARGDVIYLGTAEQVTSAEGQYLGNWVDPAGEPPAEVVALGRAVMERGRSLGYRGVAGIDVVIATDARILAIDLNFRLNGSTVALMLRNTMFRSRGAQVMRFRSWQARASFADMLTIARAGIERGELVPLSSFDPEASAHLGARARLSGLLLGTSREEIGHRERCLAAAGLE